MYQPITFFWKKNKLLIAILLFATAITYNLYTASYTNIENVHVPNIVEIEPESIDKLIQISEETSVVETTVINPDIELPVDVSEVDTAEKQVPPALLDTEKTVPLSFLIPSLSYKENVNVKEGSSVYEAMFAMQEQTDFTFSGTNYGSLGFFVESIEGIQNDTLKGKYWIYYINGKKAQMGISQYIIQPNDIITWTYEDEEL